MKQLPRFISTTLLMAALAATACATQEQDAQSDTARERQETVRASDDQAEGKAVESVHFHGLAFNSDNVLFECLELTVHRRPELQKAPEEIAKEFEEVAKLKMRKGACADSLSDRTPWASCSVAIKAEDSSDERGVIASRFYDFSDVYDSDRRFSECLEMEGDWSASPRNTPEWERARRRADAEKLQKNADEARREMERLKRRMR